MKNIQTKFASFLLASSIAASVQAGGPLELNPNDPDNFERWANGGVGIPFNPDQGGLGDLSNEETVAVLQSALQVWEDVPTATATYSNAGTMPFDVDVTNFEPFIAFLFGLEAEADGLSPIVFDADGAIFSTLFGPGSGVLGFATADTFDENGVPIEGLAFFNGAVNLAADDLRGLFVHEFGHYSGMAHTVVNGQVVALGDSSGPTFDAEFGEAPLDQVETMFPFLIDGGGQQTLHKDEISFFSQLYPAPGYLASNAGIRGTVFDLDGTTPLTGVNVIARNVDDPFVDAVSSISGDRGEPGVFSLDGLTPGANYAIYVDQILQGGFSTTPISLPGPEEFYNGSNESSDGAIDDITEFETVSVSVGQIATDVDIAFNNPAPGVPLSVGDDGFVAVQIPFNFNLCGNDFTSVFINANGTVSFGQPFTSFLENPIAFLSGPPVIAGVWDDLSPNLGGSVTYTSNPLAMTIRWEGVPEFPEPDKEMGSNTFEIVLKRNFINSPSTYTGNAFELKYENGTLTDGIAGFSCGATETSWTEQPSDLSKIRRVTANIGKTARYEVFDDENPNDLIQGDKITFLKTKDFYDVFESNDTAEDNRFVFTPFNSSPNYYFTELSPEGNDVDYFSFYAPAGKTIIAATLVSSADTLLGLFNSDGELLAIDDDGGPGLLSKIAFFVEESGFYQLAVSSWDDLEFTGAGSETGRYVLDISVREGQVLSLSEDGSQEVSLPFEFSFMGETYSSIFINANGNFTFGAGSSEFIDSPEAMLNGPPRIAPLWFDLSPQNGGDILVNSDNGQWSVEFLGVPTFASSNSNSFKTTLFADGDIEINFGRIDTPFSTTGISAGNGVADPGETDFSLSPVNPVDTTAYEFYDVGDFFDLEGTTLIFE